MTRVVQGLSGLILAGILVHSYLLAVMLLQLYLAGPNDVAAESWKWHTDWGYLLGVPILLLMAVTLIGHLGSRVIGIAALLAAMFVAQLALDRVRIDAPYLPALYAANGLAMVGLTAAIDRSRNLDGGAQRRDAAPGSGTDLSLRSGSQVETGAIPYRLKGKRITTHQVMREISKGEPAGSWHFMAGCCAVALVPGSPPQMADDLVRRPMQSQISPRCGGQIKDVRIDKGVNDERVRV